MNTSRLQKLTLGAALVAAPAIASADPATDVQVIVTTAGTVFGLAAAVGISVMTYRIVKGIISRFSK